MNKTLNHQAPDATGKLTEPCPSWCAGISCKDDGSDPLHLSAERTVPCAAIRADDGHVCGYTRSSDPAFSEPSCDRPNFAQIVADVNEITIEVGHGDDLLPAMTPDAAAKLGAALAELAATAGGRPGPVVMTAPCDACAAGACCFGGRCPCCCREPESGRLAAIRGLLAEFSGSFYEVGETRNLIERIRQIADSSRTQSGVEPGGGGYLTPADLVTALAALDQAADRKRERAARCPDCKSHPADLCDQCDQGLARAGEFDALAAKLGGGQ